MFTFRLQPEEIKKRLIRLRNLENLHKQQKMRIEYLEAENRELLKLKDAIYQQQILIKDLKLQIEELKTIIFGKKHKKKNKQFKYPDLTSSKEKVSKTLESYHRSLPKEEEVTENKFHLLPLNCACGKSFLRKKTIIFYEEDIPIPVKKIVIKHLVEKDYCRRCRKWQSAIALPNHKVILGPNIQKYICYLSIVGRLSLTQIQQLLQDTYRFHISQGEIVKILNREANNN